MEEESSVSAAKLIMLSLGEGFHVNRCHFSYLIII